MERKVLLKVVFWGSLISGVGLCIGGIFLTPLLAPGCVLLAASLAMYQSAYSADVPRGTPEEHTTPVPDIIGHRERRESDISSVNIVQNNLFFVYNQTPSPPMRPERPALDDPRQIFTLDLD